MGCTESPALERAPPPPSSADGPLGADQAVCRQCWSAGSRPQACKRTSCPRLHTNEPCWPAHLLWRHLRHLDQRCVASRGRQLQPAPLNTAQTPSAASCARCKSAANNAVGGVGLQATQAGGCKPARRAAAAHAASPVGSAAAGACGLTPRAAHPRMSVCSALHKGLSADKA